MDSCFFLNSIVLVCMCGFYNYFAHHPRQTVVFPLPATDMDSQAHMPMVRRANPESGGEDEDLAANRDHNMDQSHPAAEVCDIDECMICARRDCPRGEPLHYHHDGCPCCDMPLPLLERDVDI